MAKISKKEKIATQNKIHHAARTIFSQKGIREASLREIAKEAGVGTSTLYGYYPSKQVLFMETVMSTIRKRPIVSYNWSEMDLKSKSRDQIIDYIVDISFFLPNLPKEFDRALIREMHIMLLSEAATAEEFKQLMDKFMTKEVFAELTSLFNHLLKEELLHLELSPDALTEVITGYMRHIFLEYVVIVSATIEMYRAKYRRGIEVIMAGKL